MTSWPADFVHILNPNRKHRRFVEKYFKDRPKLKHYWVERATHPTHLETLMQWAARENVPRIAIWGGDGTFSRAIQALYLEKALDRVQVALVPSGTGNDFARKLGIPDAKKSREVVSGTHIEKYDLGLLRCGETERIFVNNSGFGRSAEAVRRPRPSAIRDIFSFRPRQLTLEWHTKTSTEYQTHVAILGIVFNSAYFNSGLCFDPGVEPNDGMLSGFFEPPGSPWALLVRFIQGRFGVPLVRRKTLRIDGHSLFVESDDLLFPQVDGERASTVGVKRLSYETLPEALSLARWDR